MPRGKEDHGDHGGPEPEKLVMLFLRVAFFLLLYCNSTIMDPKIQFLLKAPIVAAGNVMQVHIPL